MSIVACALVAAPVFSKRFAAAFETTFSIFLGRISFPVYLMQIPVICSLGAGVYFYMSRYGFSAAMVTGAALILSIIGTIAAAIIFLSVEGAAIRVSRRLSDLFLNPLAMSVPALDSVNKTTTQDSTTSGSFVPLTSGQSQALASTSASHLAPL
jgi:peptidoglycan/LPS O-acetylase OafA/YrhL